MTQIQITINTKPDPVPVPTRPPLWMHLEDRESGVFGGGLRSCTPCPAIFVLLDDQHAIFDKQWQFYVRAINYNMSIQYVTALYEKARAFFNRTGFPGKRNWLTGEDMDQPDPNKDKVRTCSRNVLTGVPAYSLMQTLKDAGTLVRSLVRREQTIMGLRQSFTALATNNVLEVETFDSRQPPPLKTGRRYPERVEDIDIDDYLFTPQSNRERFVVANIVNKAGEFVPFPNGALYPWTGDGIPYSFLPIVSNHGYGKVRYSLAKLRKLADHEPIPSPYRFM